MRDVLVRYRAASAGRTLPFQEGIDLLKECKFVFDGSNLLRHTKWEGGVASFHELVCAHTDTPCAVVYGLQGLREVRGTNASQRDTDWASLQRMAQLDNVRVLVVGCPMTFPRGKTLQISKAPTGSALSDVVQEWTTVEPTHVEYLDDGTAARVVNGHKSPPTHDDRSCDDHCIRASVDFKEGTQIWTASKMYPACYSFEDTNVHVVTRDRKLVTTDVSKEFVGDVRDVIRWYEFPKHSPLPAPAPAPAAVAPAPAAEEDGGVECTTPPSSPRSSTPPNAPRPPGRHVTWEGEREGRLRQPDVSSVPTVSVAKQELSVFGTTYTPAYGYVRPKQFWKLAADDLDGSGWKEQRCLPPFNILILSDDIDLRKDLKGKIAVVTPHKASHFGTMDALIDHVERAEFLTDIRATRRVEEAGLREDRARRRVQLSKAEVAELRVEMALVPDEYADEDIDAVSAVLREEEDKAKNDLRANLTTLVQEQREKLRAQEELKRKESASVHTTYLVRVHADGIVSYFVRQHYRTWEEFRAYRSCVKLVDAIGENDPAPSDFPGFPLTVFRSLQVAMMDAFFGRWMRKQDLERANELNPRLRKLSDHELMDAEKSRSEAWWTMVDEKLHGHYDG